MEVIQEGMPEASGKKRGINTQVKSKSSRKTNKSGGSNHQSKKRLLSPPMDAAEIDSTDGVKITNILTKKRHSSIEDKPVKLAKTKVKKSASKIVNGRLMTHS